MPADNLEIVITDEFEEGFRRVKDGTPFIFFTGRAGTGKSTFVELLKKRLNSFAVLAPTGVAAFLAHSYRSSFFFSARVFEQLRPMCLEFTKVFRRTDEKFVALLNQIREGRGLDEAITLLNERVRAQPAEGGQVIVLTGTNAVADRINRRQLASLGAASRIYEGKITGEFRVEKTKLPAPLELELKEGARVMFVRNDGSKRWVNGTVGTILELDSSTVKVRIQDQWGDRTVRVETKTWKNCKYKYNAEEHAVTALEVGSYTQLRLSNLLSVNLFIPSLGLLLRSFFHIQVRHFGLDPAFMNFYQHGCCQA